MSNLEMTGKVIAILEKKSGTSKAGKAWVSQEYVIETSDQYPKKCCFALFGEERITACNIQMGETITAHIDIDARQWEQRWFNSISAWKIDRSGVSETQTQQQEQASVADSKDDMPF
jgi:hypothetical protein